MSFAHIFGPDRRDQAGIAFFTANSKVLAALDH
jgi:hypothetical protein